MACDIHDDRKTLAHPRMTWLAALRRHRHDWVLRRDGQDYTRWWECRTCPSRTPKAYDRGLPRAMPMQWSLRRQR